MACSTLLCGCAGLHTDRHVAPIYTEISSAGGGSRIEALGGSLILRRPIPGSPFDQWGLRPLFIHDRIGRRAGDTDFLTPLGTVRQRPDDLTVRMTPLVHYRRVDHADGTVQWSLLTIIGVYVARFPDGRVVRAWFPFAGVIERLLSFDRLTFVMWPLFTETQRGEITTYHLFWPIFAWSVGEGSKTWRFWPLIGRRGREGAHDRWFFLWPIFQYHRDNLKAQPEFHSHKWFVFPLVGHARQGTFRSTSVLWPFFGYSTDPRSGFWAWDGPWPLVRIQRPGTSGTATRTRFWPAWSRYEGDRMTSTWVAFPVVNRRHERYPDGARDAFVVIPFWQSLHRRYDSGHEFRHQKLWPFYERERFDRVEQLAFPALSPLWRAPRMDRMYAWMWELYTGQRGEGVARQRTWLGLWRRERDADEDRRYLSGLWSNRRYTLAGERVSETSLLFGLVRWRSGSKESSGMMRPAVPGPGWPHERMPAAAGVPPYPPGRAPLETEWIDFP